MKKHRTLTGKIVRGVSKAAYFTQLDWVQEQCMNKLGFKPYPGTLNLEILEDFLPVLESLREAKALTLTPPDPQFCEASVRPVMINGIPGALIIPAEDVSVHGKQILEILAPVRLKDALQMEDGDIVTLEI